MYEVAYWINGDEATTRIYIDGSAKVRIGRPNDTIIVNGVSITLGGSVSYIKDPQGHGIYY